MLACICVPGELMLLNGFGLTISMFLVCFSGIYTQSQLRVEN